MRRWIERLLRGTLSSWFVAAGPAVVGMAGGGTVGTLPEAPGPRGEQTTEQAAIERQPVCVGSSVQSAGRLSDVLYYRAVATKEGRIAVGYFVFFSEERPWGNNWLTWSVLPALTVDMVYSRALWIAPGVQRALYGPGDVEGLSIVYDVGAGGSLSIDHALVDDGSEQMLEVTRSDVLALDPQRPTFYSNVWSHQLGGHSAHSRRDLVEERCYQGDDIRPLPDGLARTFRLDEHTDRAPPAHVERIAGRRLDDVQPPRDVLARAR